MAQEPNEEGQKQPDVPPKKHPAEDFYRETRAARALPSARVHLITYKPPAKSPPTKPQP